MRYTLSDAAIAQIQRIADGLQTQPSITPGQYAPIYQIIYSDPKNRSDVSQGIKNLLDIAIHVNSGNPNDLVFQCVRTETQIPHTAAQLSYNTNIGVLSAAVAIRQLAPYRDGMVSSK